MKHCILRHLIQFTLGALLIASLLLAARPAEATHPGCSEGTTEACCTEATAATSDACYAESAAMAQTPTPCFFGPQICGQFQADRDADCDIHLAVFRDNPFGIGMPYAFSYQDDLNARILAGEGACAVTETGENCVADAAQVKNDCKAACAKGKAGKSCRDTCQTTFVAFVHVCNAPGL